MKARLSQPVMLGGEGDFWELAFFFLFVWTSSVVHSISSFRSAISAISYM